MEGKWFYVYILYSLKDFKLYIGFTMVVNKRVADHNDGKNTSTACRRPLVLILAEAFMNEKDARQREKFYKTGRGREVIKKKLEHTLNYLNSKYKK